MKSNVFKKLFAFFCKIFGLNKPEGDKPGKKPSPDNTPGTTPTLEVLRETYKKYPYPVDFVPNELIIYHKPGGKRENVYTGLRQFFPDLRIPHTEKVETCKCCNHVELVKHLDIHLYAHFQRVSPVSGSTTGVGEDSDAYYFLNFVINHPEDSKSPVPPFVIPKFPVSINFNTSKEVIIAVLDNGIEKSDYLGGFLWQNSGGNCDYSDEINGWNFVADSEDIFDEDSFHGNLVSGFILEQVVKNSNGSVSPKLMTLKVLDSEGKGNLMNFICAVCFAKSFGANIINASLGFYTNDFVPEPPRESEDQNYPLSGASISDILHQLIVKDLGERNIIFVAAAGNAMDSNEREFNKAGSNGDIRKLDDNPFFFANLGDTEDKAKNNIVTFTTVGEDKGDLSVANTQNYSPNYVDFGIQSDTNDYEFNIPFQDSANPPQGELLRGSSYAAAIGTGKIASLMASGQSLVGARLNEGIMERLKAENQNDDGLLHDYIKDGKYLKR